MVILDHNPVIQTHAMVLRTTHAGGIFFHLAPARKGFAGIKQSGGRIAHRRDIAACGGGNARQMLQGIEGCAFRGQDAACIAFDHGQHVLGGNRIAVLAMLGDFGIGDQFAETFKGDIQTGDHDILACFKGDAQARIGGDDIVRCDVTGADILGKGAVDEFGNFSLGQDGHGGAHLFGGGGWKTAPRNEISAGLLIRSN